ncbi:MAG TPA: LysM peptidoglycan-binding domain-containing protein [Candidatus Cybelea sp.]|nr:LysM peptidoglycan-binding domain-containing protein [Candidatus Cybelea sp.]
MNRLTLVATIGAVLVAAILGLIYAVSKQDATDTQEPAAQSQPAGQPSQPVQTTSQASNQVQGQPQSQAPQPATQPAPAPAATTPQPASPAPSQTTTAAQPTQPPVQAPAAAPAQPQQQAAAPAPSGAPSAAPTQAPAQPSAPASGQAPAAPAQPTTQPSVQPAPQQQEQQLASAAQQPGGAASATPAQAPAAAPEVKPSFDVVRVNPNGDAVVAGRSAPGAKITLLDNGKPVGSATADDRGEWVLLPDSSVDPGQHNFSLKASDDKGVSLESEKEVIVVVPKPAEDIAGQPVTRPSGALAIEVPKQGEAPTQLLNAPGSATAQTASAQQASGSAAPPPLSLDTIDYTQDGRAMLSGHTLPDSDLILYLDNATLGAAKADDSGRWTFVPDTKAPVGDHELRVDLVDGTGKVLARVKVPFAQPDFSTVTLNDNTVIVQPGNSLWRIARRTYGHGVLFTVIYEANKDRIGDPDLIYPGQIFQLPQKKSN